MEDTHINVRVSIKEIRDALLKRVRPLGAEFHNELIVDAIIDNLATTEVGLEQLYLAFSGVSVEIPFKVFDKVLVPFAGLATWKMNENNMRDQECMFKGKVKAEIEQINIRKISSIKVVYTIVDDHNNVATDSYWVKPSQVELYESLIDDTSLS